MPGIRTVVVCKSSRGRSAVVLCVQLCQLRGSGGVLLDLDFLMYAGERSRRIDSGRPVSLATVRARGLVVVYESRRVNVRGCEECLEVPLLCRVAGKAICCAVNICEAGGLGAENPSHAVSG